MLSHRQVQAQHRKFEDPRNELFYGISRASWLQGPYGPPSTETISGKCDQPGRLWVPEKCLLRDGKPTYYFAVRIMAATGVRISELLQIRVEDMIRGQMDLYSKVIRSGGSTSRKCPGDLPAVASKRKAHQRQLIFKPFRKSDHHKRDPGSA